MGIDSGVPNAPPAETGKWGQAVEIDLSQSVNTDTVTQDIRQFRSSDQGMKGGSSPTLQNTGIVKDGGVTELWETVYASIPNAIAGYVTSNGLGLAVTTPDSGATIVYNKVIFSNGSYAISPILSTNSNLDIPNNSNCFFQRYSVSGYFDMTPIASGTAPTSALGLKIGPTSVIIDEVDVITKTIYNTKTFTTTGQAQKAYLTRVGNTFDGQSTFATQTATYGFVYWNGSNLLFQNNSGTKVIGASFATSSGPSYFIPSSGYYMVPSGISGSNGLYFSTAPLSSWTSSLSAPVFTNIARNYGNATSPLIQSTVPIAGSNTGFTYNINTTAVKTSFGIWAGLTTPVVVSGYTSTPWGQTGTATSASIAHAAPYSTWIGSIASPASAFTGNIDLTVPLGSVSLNARTIYLNANTINGKMGFLHFSSSAANSSNDGSGGKPGSSLNEYGDLPAGTPVNQLYTQPVADDVLVTVCPNIISGSNYSTVVAYKTISGTWTFVDIFNPIPLTGQSSSYGSTITFNEILPGVVIPNDINGTILDINASIPYLDVGPTSPNSGINTTVQLGTGFLYAFSSSNKYSNTIYSAPFQSSYNNAVPPQTPNNRLFTNNIDSYFGTTSTVYQGSSNGTVDDAKVGSLYANQSNVPFVHTATLSGGVISLINNAAIQLPGFASYNIANFIGSYTWPQFGGASGNYVSTSLIGFILFGYYYGYDGTYIYSLNLSGGSTGTLVGQPQILVRAQGLIFLCVTPTEAVFLSTFDNSVWSFNGGRTVEKVKAFNQQSSITNGYYDVFESALFLTSTSGYLTQRDGILSKNTYSSAFSGSVPQANPSSQGLFWSYVNSSGNLIFTQRTYNKISGSNPLPLTYQTSYYGPGNGMVLKIQRVAMQIYCSAGLTATLQLTLSYKTTDNAGNNATQTITIYPSGTTQTGNLIIQTPGSSGEGYAWFDWSPTSKYGVGSSLTVSDTTSTPTQKIAILDMIWYYTIDGVEPITGKVTGG